MSRGRSVPQQEVGKGVARVAAVEGEAAARGRRVLKIERRDALVSESGLDIVPAVRPAQRLENLVIALAVARAGLVEKAAEAHDRDRRQTTQVRNWGDQAGDELARIDVPVLRSSEVVNVQQAETNLVDQVRRKEARVRGHQVARAGAEPGPVAELIGAVADCADKRAVVGGEEAAGDTVLCAGLVVDAPGVTIVRLAGRRVVDEVVAESGGARSLHIRIGSELEQLL